MKTENFDADIKAVVRGLKRYRYELVHEAGHRWLSSRWPVYISGTWGAGVMCGLHSNKRRKPRHGTYSCYVHGNPEAPDGCRCERCKAAAHRYYQQKKGKPHLQPEGS
jgi:hypothetical protein